jgi:hypothetical protein
MYLMLKFKWKIMEWRAFKELGKSFVKNSFFHEYFKNVSMLRYFICPIPPTVHTQSFPAKNINPTLKHSNAIKKPFKYLPKKVPDFVVASFAVDFLLSIPF